MPRHQPRRRRRAWDDGDRAFAVPDHQELRVPDDVGHVGPAPVSLGLALAGVEAGVVDGHRGLAYVARGSPSPSLVTPAHVLAWAYGIGASGREPASATVGARIACLSSYYRFLIRMGIATSNPCDALERPRSVKEAGPRAGRSTRCGGSSRWSPTPWPDDGTGPSCWCFVLTGRAARRGDRADRRRHLARGPFYAYRGKGGKRGRRELPRPAHQAILATLVDAGLELTAMEPAASLWQSGAGARGVTSSTFY